MCYPTPSSRYNVYHSNVANVICFLDALYYSHEFHMKDGDQIAPQFGKSFVTSFVLSCSSCVLFIRFLMTDLFCISYQKGYIDVLSDILSGIIVLSDVIHRSEYRSNVVSPDQPFAASALRMNCYSSSNRFWFHCICDSSQDNSSALFFPSCGVFRPVTT